MKNLIEKLNEENSGIQIAADLSMKDVVILKLEGTLDTFNSKNFIKASIELLEDVNLESLVFDLETFVYISATGVNAIINIVLECFKRNKKVYLLNIEQKITEVFKLLGLYSQFRIISDLSEIGTNNGKLFPRKVMCIECKGKLNLFKPGKFKCPSCKNVFKIDEEGIISEFRR